MNEHIEIEYKILLTKDIYNQIIKDYHRQIKNKYTQTNYYFTHPILQEKKYMLRMREKEDYAELTLKRPINDHNLETNVRLSPQQAKNIKESKKILLQNEITDILQNEGIHLQELQQLFSLTTLRYDIVLDEGVLSLDHNTYLDKEDYELEFEVYDEHIGYHKFLDIINSYHLHYTHNAKSKFKRILDSL